MKVDKKWLLMTYYCPTHGDLSRVEPIEMTREEIFNSSEVNTKSKE